MAKELSVEDAVERARAAQESRIDSIRQPAKVRQHLADAREQVAQTERDDVLAYKQPSAPAGPQTNYARSATTSQQRKPESGAGQPPAAPKRRQPADMTTAATSDSQAQAVLGAAADYFRTQLTASWVPDYMNRRNLYPMLDPAQIGYAPAHRTALIEHLHNHGYSHETQIRAGIARRHGAATVAHFADRLMVPVTNADRGLAGFIGRASENADDDVPKYLNSPRSDHFDKGSLLYGLGEERAAIKGGHMPILVEGPLDRLAVLRVARNHAISPLATCGTALTTRHAQTLADILGSRRPIAVALDADPAGQGAAVRAWDRLTAAGLTHLLHVQLPPGQDPADMVRAGRGDRLRKAISHTRPLAFVVADHRITEAGDLDHIGKRINLVRHLATTDLPHVNPQWTGPYIAHLANRLALDHHDVSEIAATALGGTQTRS